jgi:hypothetical protein
MVVGYKCHVKGIPAPRWCEKILGEQIIQVPIAKVEAWDANGRKVSAPQSKSI